MPAPSTPASKRRWTTLPPRSSRASGPLYRPRRPTATPLYPVVQHHLETFLAAQIEPDSEAAAVPAWVERDFRAYLRCGIPAYGFARVRCGDCGQWVLSLPKRLRPSALRKASPGTPGDAELAALSFPQRFGSSLNAHFHFHVLAIDGVFSEEPPGSGEVVLHGATQLTEEHWQRVERAVQRRVLRLFNKRALPEDDTVQDMLGWQASSGFSVDASVRIEGDDRAGVERLIRYCARPPLALERLYAVDGQESLASEEARLLYRLPEGDVQG